MARQENQSGGRRRPSRERPPDIEIGAAARAKRLRFEEKPDSEVRFKGKSIEEQSESDSVRRNLPDEVEPDVTYHDVEIGWRAEAWAEGEESSETPAAGEH